MDTENKMAIFYITNNGLGLARRLKRLHPGADVLRFKPEVIPEFWEKCKFLLFIMAAGIVVRTIAPLIRDKKTDPAVVVLDEKGRFVISLLSGHLGGANRLAQEIADFLNSDRGAVGETKSLPRTEAVITTASDVNNLFSIDMWAQENNLIIEDWDLVPQIGTRFVNNGALRIYREQNIEIKLPDGFLEVSDPKFADVLITKKIKLISGFQAKGQLYLRPKNLVIGIGCNSGTPADEIEEAVKKTLEENNLSFLSIQSIATIGKKGNEPGLIALAKKYNLEMNIFTPDELNSVKGIPKSEAAFRATGANAVAEPAVLLASGAMGLLIPKQKRGNVTVAVAELQRHGETEKRGNVGKVYIVGIGPGSNEHITPYAREAIMGSDVIVGYSTYLDLIQDLIRDKEVISTGMTQEVERCKGAVELAMGGKTVVVVSGGDPGIYAMAGLVFEILRNKTAVSGGQLAVSEKLTTIRYPLNSESNKLQTVHVEVIPGISALNACAAKLGAPLTHDFACISLSDRLTPWDLIEKRLEAAAMADFVLVLFNPKSLGRQRHINRAREIILKYRNPETPVGIVTAAARENEKIVITNLKEMLNYEIDMQTTVIIGNSKSFIWNSWIITPRGYEGRYGAK